MLQLAGGTHFLVLRTERGYHSVHSFRRFDEALARHDGNTRLSPIFAIAGAPPPSFPEDTTTHLLFLGPIHPGRVAVPEGVHAYISLGLLNLVLFCQTEESLKKVQGMIGPLGVGWELWSLSGNRIIDSKYNLPGSSRPVEQITNPIRKDISPILPTIREFQSAMANAVGKAQLHNQSAEELLLRYNEVFRRLLGEPTIQDVEKLQFLVTANVAIARVTWQTYGGSSPIAETPIQLATYSLLGIGTAVLALQALTRFVEQVFEEVRITDTLLQLATIPSQGTPLVSLAASDIFWAQDFVGLIDRRALPPATSPNLPQFASFSGRDGFRSTSVSLSAPIEVITGCNTESWTLQTLTHEISHSQVRAVLGAMLPDPSKREDLELLWAQMVNPALATNLLARLRIFLVDAVRLMRAHGPQESLTKSGLLAVLKASVHEADEILTHVFDFLYFYRGEETPYLRSLWASWATIPHIEDRVGEYITRSLCALYANGLRRENGPDLALETLENNLVKLNKELTNPLYIKKALTELQTKRDRYLSALQKRGPIVKFARHILWSSKVAGLLNRSADPSSLLTPGVFAEQKVSNPLAFASTFSSGKTPDAIRAVWILHQLAYGAEP